ncbi:ABC transporter ATP-binding protein [Cutibacterium avidum]|uniref:ABC transporter ATP-binding protein n=1 Tax=Cutibacterium avidum TaxID=33010 RepID=UPI0008F5C824|nr:ABC transporter ATP-binding protein [Cutibacterium avidum]MDK7698094.1 ABC transporter ATP-binding protein [Cutibacterium avidum]OIJ79821.1 lipoprotein ABC transporter ATP-binding protein [Cutibacterium avidum]
MLVVEDLEKSFGSRCLWSGLNFVVEPGTMVALVGASGSGKTTLLNCIGTLDRPTSGRITWDGLDVTRASARQAQQLRRRDIGYLFQSYALVENASIAQNINYAVAGPWPWVRRSYDDELGAVGLAGRGREPVYQLSGGEQQRVALARIMAKKPRLVLADEPTGALDEANGAAVVRILRDLTSQGATVVIATHNPEVRDACDHCIDLSRIDVPEPPERQHQPA